MTGISRHTGFRLIAAFWLLMAGYTFYLRNWEHPKRILYWDVLSYYAYLPAAFIHNDLSLSFIDKNPERYTQQFWPEEGPNGAKVIKTGMGMAVIYAPFFGLGHATALLLGDTADGFSHPYRIGLIAGSLLYLLLGCMLLYDYLCRFFSPFISVTTLFCLLFGTNLFYYTIGESTMPHVYNFALITLFLWVVDRQWRRGGFSGWQLGLLLGFIALVRPTNIWVGAVLLLYGVRNFAELKERLNIVMSWRFALPFVLMGIAVWLPQMAYWKYTTGQFLYFSYTGERFFFNHPHIIEGLFGFRKGWLIYTPIMAIALLGLLRLWRDCHPLGRALPLFLAVQIYVMLSWWSWWYGGGFGMRPMVDVYGLLAVALGAMLSYVHNKRHKWPKAVMVLLMGFLIFLNQFQTRQYRYEIIHWDSMTRAAYFHVFLSRDRTGVDALLEEPDYEGARGG